MNFKMGRNFKKIEIDFLGRTIYTVQWDGLIPCVTRFLLYTFEVGLYVFEVGLFQLPRCNYLGVVDFQIFVFYPNFYNLNIKKPHTQQQSHVFFLMELLMC